MEYKMKFNITVLILGVLISLFPTYKLYTAITNAGSFDPDIEMDYLDFFNPEIYRNSEKTDLYISENFNLYISTGYMDKEEAENYLVWIENRLQKAVDYIGCREEMIRDNKKIDIFLLDTPGTSFSMGDYFVVYHHLEGMDVSVHEMTHSVDYKLNKQRLLHNEGNNSDIYGFNDDCSNFFLEQRAVLIEDKFGKGVGFPNYGLPINPMIYERLRNGVELESFSALNSLYMMMEEGDYETSAFRYIVAGSFGQFLEKKYGFDKYNKVIVNGYKESLGKSLTELERDWLSWLRKGSILQNILMIIFAIGILIIAQFWLKQRSKTFLTGLPGILILLIGFLSWGYYLSYGDNDLWGIVLAVILGGLFKIWQSKAGIIALWCTGFITVIFPFLMTIYSL